MKNKHALYTLADDICEQFIQMPSEIENPNSIFGKISVEARLLYTFIWNRSKTSNKNRHIDKNGNVFVYYTIKEVQRNLKCGKSKAISIMKELVENYFVVKKKNGLGMPDRIYVYDYGKEIN